MANIPATTDPALILAGIIRQVDGKRELGAAALAEAILAHPGSRWGPVATAAAAENSGAAAWPAAWPGISDSLTRSLILAGIIRQVDGKHNLSPDALAEAILKHSGSYWGQAVTPTNGQKPPVPTNTELEANFRAWFKAEYDTEYFDGLALCDAKAAIVAWVKHLLQQSAQPAAPWPELPEKPPLPEGICQNTWLTGFDQGWQAARAELQRQREQAQPLPPAAWPEISDSLIRRLVGDIAAIASETTIAVCFGNHVDPIKEARACLLEVLELAAKENKA